MACEVNNKEINSQCAELLVRPTYLLQNISLDTKSNKGTTVNGLV